jgi:aldehyde dehydrogenase (NAD+)
MEAQDLSPERIDALVNPLRAHFDSGATRPFAARRQALLALREALHKHEEALLEAMHADMRKPRFEAYLSDIGLVHAEITYALRHLREWMSVEHVPTPLAIQLASSTMHHEPLGLVLIVAPWNYPVLLLLSPLVGAIAAGNCAVVKPSNEGPRTVAVVEQLITEAFAPEHVRLVQGPGGEVVPRLMARHRFDHIFFTGSPAVGAKIMAMAASGLTPVTLELGGKSPAIVDRKADIGLAAGRIAWSKYFNAGQTCVATDHALVHSAVMDEFLAAFAKHVQRFFGDDPRRSPHFARLVNDKRFAAVSGYLGHGKIALGGQHDAADRYIAPTVLTQVPLESPPMREEIFGPVLPILPWSEPEEVISITQRNPWPLATYIFSNDRKAQRYFTGTHRLRWRLHQPYDDPIRRTGPALSAVSAPAV